MKDTDKMPARIWVDEALGMVGYVNEAPPPESDFRHEYVRADLLATARKAAFKDAAEIVARLPVRINRSGVKKGSDLNGWSSAINEAVIALERAATTDKER